MSTRRGFLIRTGVLLGVAGLAWWQRDNLLRPSPRIDGPAAGDWLDFQAPGPTPVVQATLLGQPVRALVDTGAQASALDATFAATLPDLADFPLPILAYGAGGHAVAGRAANLDMTVGGMTARGIRAAVLDLGMLARKEGLGAPLVLGQDVLSALAIQVDFAARRLRFHQAETFAPPAEAETLPTRRQGRALFADVQVEATTVALMVDTGASAALSLRTEAARAAGLLDGRPLRSGRALALGGVIEGAIVKVGRARLGDAVFDGAEAHIYAQQAVSPVPGVGPQLPDGLLGAGAFRRDHMVFDLSRGALHRLAPSGVRPLDIGPRRPRTSAG